MRQNLIKFISTECKDPWCIREETVWKEKKIVKNSWNGGGGEIFKSREVVKALCMWWVRVCSKDGYLVCKPASYLSLLLFFCINIYWYYVSWIRWKISSSNLPRNFSLTLNFSGIFLQIIMCILEWIYFHKVNIKGVVKKIYLSVSM